MRAREIDRDTTDAVRRFLSQIVGGYDMAGAILFGSRARGSHRADSDADLAILLRGVRQRRLPVTLAMADLADDVLRETGINITPLPIWMDEWEHPEIHDNPDLVRRIARDGVRL